MLSEREKEVKNKKSDFVVDVYTYLIRYLFIFQGKVIEQMFSGPCGEVIILEKWGMLTFPLNQSDLESLWGKQM